MMERIKHMISSSVKLGEARYTWDILAYGCGHRGLATWLVLQFKLVYSSW